jgi:hypothetical protein
MALTTPSSADEIQGFEFDWLASDNDGHVALFSTGGAGYAPDEFLRDTEAHHAAIDAILALPTSTVATFAPDVPAHLVNTWRLVAERGLYAFDCDPCGGPYELVAAPAAPIRADALPFAIAKIVGGIRVRLGFAANEIVTEEQLRDALR